MKISRIQMIFLVLVLLISVFSIGCSTTGDVLQAKDEGTSKIYPVTKEQAWDIAVMVFRWEGADAIEQHPEEGYMLTSSGMNLVSYGSVMGAWVEPLGIDQTKVTVVTKRRLSTNLVTTLTESTFHNRFAQGVDFVKAGKPLPHSPPK